MQMFAPSSIPKSANTKCRFLKETDHFHVCKLLLCEMRKHGTSMAKCVKMFFHELRTSYSEINFLLCEAKSACFTNCNI